MSNGEITHKAFWSESSELYKYLKNCFLKIEWKYDFNINSFSNQVIPSYIVQIITKQIELELEDLINIYKTKDADGFNYVEEIYKGVNYKLFYKSSHLHHQISRLIRIHRRFVEADDKNESIQVIGNAKVSKEMVHDIREIKKAIGNHEISLDHLEIKTFGQLIRERCLISDVKNYKLTLKGTIIDIPEN
jgi:hypothetical protein